jgi:hypothetical protein
MRSYHVSEMPFDIQEYMAGASEDDYKRLEIIGVMRVAGVYQRTHTTNVTKRVTILRFASINAVGANEAKEICEGFALHVYGLADAKFFQTADEQKQSTEDRLYFHAICNHKKD